MIVYYGLASVLFIFLLWLFSVLTGGNHANWIILVGMILLFVTSQGVRSGATNG